jgi:hypothetical protein
MRSAHPSNSIAGKSSPQFLWRDLWKSPGPVRYLSDQSGFLPARPSCCSSVARRLRSSIGARALHVLQFRIPITD